MNYVTLDDMTAMVFALGVARIDSNWELAVSLISGAILVRFAKAWVNQTPIAGKK